MRSVSKDSLSKVQAYAESLGLNTFFSKKGDLIIKKRGPRDWDAVGTEMFERYERETLQTDELEHIITILIR